MELITLDRRYNYHRHFKYCLDFKGLTSIKRFINTRSFLITHWGQSIEANLYTSMMVYRAGVHYTNIPWSWSQISDWHYRIYIVDSVAVAELRLRGLIE